MLSLLKTRWVETFDTLKYFINKILFDIDERHMLFMLQFYIDTNKIYFYTYDFYPIFFLLQYSEF